MFKKPDIAMFYCNYSFFIVTLRVLIVHKMAHSNYSRPLDNPDAVLNFTTKTLGINLKEKQIAAIVKAEHDMRSEIKPDLFTLNGNYFRCKSYKTESNRWKLRKKIVQELYDLPRLDDDDKIKLGCGGAKPQTIVKKDAQAYIIIGLPAAGKSSISSKLADYTGSYVLDSDFAKRKLPEFKHYGATIVHEESDMLIFPRHVEGKPADFQSLFEKCVKEKINICTLKIGYSTAGIIELCHKFSTYKYKIHIVLVALDRQKATIRAINRFNNTKRYVSLGLIFDCYANDPTLTYYRLKALHDENPLFESMCKISTDVPKGSPPKIKNIVNDSPLKDIYV